MFRINDDGSYTRLRDLPSATAWFATRGALDVVNASGTWPLGRPGSSGDGGPAQSARLNPSAIAFAPNGDLYIIDNNRIRRLTGSGPRNPPVIAPGGIVNAASYTGGAIAPGELISIFGSNFGRSALETNSPENNFIPPVLGRTKVLFDGLPGAITAATPNQINVFVPYGVMTGTSVEVRVQVDAAVSAPVSVPVAGSAFGLFTTDSSGSGQGAILNQNSSQNSSANPAPRGSIVSLFGTGEGRTLPPLPDGALVLSTPYPAPETPVVVTIGGQPAEVFYQGAAPTLPTGVLQINAMIPAGITPGSVPVDITVGGSATSRRVTVAVR